MCPIIEKAVDARGGQVKLVKINIDENPAYAGQLGVRSIPAVYAFDKGRPVDAFMGALPEGQINAFIDKLVKKRLNPLPREIADTIFFLKAYLPAADRLAIYRRYVWKLPKDRVSNVLAGLRRLRELYHPTDPSRDYLRATEVWLQLSEDIAAALEQRRLPALPPMDSRAYRNETARRLAADLRRNGFWWLHAQSDPDELGGGVVSGIHITPDRNWAAAKLATIAPHDVVGRLRCLHYKRRRASNLTAQARYCDAVLRQHPRSTLNARTRTDVVRLIAAYTSTMRREHCLKLASKLANTMFGATTRASCWTKAQRRVRERTDHPAKVMGAP